MSIWKPEINLRCHSPVVVDLGLALPVRLGPWDDSFVPPGFFLDLSFVVQALMLDG